MENKKARRIIKEAFGDIINEKDISIENSIVRKQEYYIWYDGHNVSYTIRDNTDSYIVTKEIWTIDEDKWPVIKSEEERTITK